MFAIASAAAVGEGSGTLGVPTGEAKEAFVLGGPSPGPPQPVWASLGPGRELRGLPAGPSALLPSQCLTSALPVTYQCLTQCLTSPTL